MRDSVDAIVARYRQIIVLLSGEDALAPAERDLSNLVGRLIFHENQQALGALAASLTTEIESGGLSQAAVQTSHFLDLIESGADLHDADKLSVREVLADLAASVAGLRGAGAAKTALAARIEDDLHALAEIQGLYEKELAAIFGRFDTRGMPVRREAWERYVAYLHTRYTRGDILKSYEGLASKVGVTGKNGALRRNTAFEITGEALPPKTFVLTFDDGPHPRYTDRVREVLTKYGISSVFFQVGRNLGTLTPTGVTPTRASGATKRLVESGFAIGSHSHSHTLLPTMTDREVAAEIDRTNKLLGSVANIHTPLFRPPYGGTALNVAAAIAAHQMKSVLWNIDSRDWADPIATSIANRVIAEARRQNRGIILLHDIHERSVEALPLIVETLTKEGYQFAAWNGTAFAADPAQSTRTSPPADDGSPYRNSWAVIVGIDDYPRWPKLRYAVNDATAMRDLLIRKFGFRPDHITTLLNADATRERILSALGDTLSNPKTVLRDDRVFVFFAGHGATRRLPNGRDLGYVVPYDAGTENFQGQLISMTNFQDVSDAIPAKHVLFVMDSCYSGLGLTRGAGMNQYLREMARRTARQMLTAGGADQEVADNGPNGHSVFTWTLLQALEGRADLNADGYISAAELASYVTPGVSAISRQTPAFGSLPGSEGGEFVFELRPETGFLSQMSAQLDQEAIQLNSELDRIRQEVAAKTARNDKLRQEVAAARAQQTGEAAPAPTPLEAAARQIDLGNRLYREKRYPESLEAFLAAAKLNPASAEAANNAGYLLSKLGRVDEARRWYEKTIEIAPRRAVVYVNLGDLYYEQNRRDEARRMYEKYLELSPNAQNAATIRARLGG